MRVTCRRAGASHSLPFLTAWTKFSYLRNGVTIAHAALVGISLAYLLGFYSLGPFSLVSDDDHVASYESGKCILYARLSLADILCLPSSTMLHEATAAMRSSPSSILRLLLQPLCCEFLYAVRLPLLLHCHWLRLLCFFLFSHIYQDTQAERTRKASQHARGLHF